MKATLGDFECRLVHNLSVIVYFYRIKINLRFHRKKSPGKKKDESNWKYINHTDKII